MTNGGNIRLSIVLSREEHRMLILWAKFHGKSKSTYAGQIIGTRIESNAQTIMNLVAIAAKQNGISEEEQIALWLNENEDEED